MERRYRVLNSHREVFKEELGKLKGHEANIYIDSGALPRFCKAQSVPYAMRSKVESELTHLECDGVIEPIQFADWAAPIVPVLKGDKQSIRIYGDFKLKHPNLTSIQYQKLKIYLPRWQEGSSSQHWICLRLTNRLF